MHIISPKLAMYKLSNFDQTQRWCPVMTIVDAAGAHGTYWLEFDAIEDRLVVLTGYWRGITGHI
jgi:hypothetical protein